MKRRILGLALCLVLALSLLPFSVFAVTDITEIEISNINTALKADERPEFTAVLSDASAAQMEISHEGWSDYDRSPPTSISSDFPGGSFVIVGGHYYEYGIYFKAKEGYVFTENTVLKYNGSTFKQSEIGSSLFDGGKSLGLWDFINVTPSAIDFKDLTLDLSLGGLKLTPTQAAAFANGIYAASEAGQVIIDESSASSLLDLDKDGSYDLSFAYDMAKERITASLMVDANFSLTEDFILTLNKDALDFAKNNLGKPCAETINFQFRGEEIPYTLDLSGGPVTISDPDVLKGLINTLEYCSMEGVILGDFMGPYDHDADYDLDKDGKNDISVRAVSEDSMEFSLLETASFGDSVDVKTPLAYVMFERSFGDPFYTTITVTTKAETPKANPFVDVKEGDPYYDAVLWAYYAEPQVTNGMDDTHFGPSLTVTRGQCVAFLWRAMGEPEPTSTANPFVDIPASQYYYKPVLWAVEKGITKGVDATHFNPDDTLSTQHIVTFLYRAANPGSDGWDGPAAAWAGSFDTTGHSYPFGINIAVSNETPCPRANVVQFLYAYKNA